MPRRIVRAFGAVIAMTTGAALFSACGSGGSADTAQGTVTQTIEIIATEYAFSGDPATEISAGETVRIVVRNEGGLRHELQLLDTDARLIDRTEELEPGATGEITVTFDSPGVYQVICDIDDHLSRGSEPVSRSVDDGGRQSAGSDHFDVRGDDRRPGDRVGATGDVRGHDDVRPQPQR